MSTPKADYEPGARAKKTQTCSTCGSEFLAHRSDVERCPSCKKQHDTERKRLERSSLPRVGKGNYLREAKYECACANCGEKFTAKQPNAKWCEICRALLPADRHPKAPGLLALKLCIDCGKDIEDDTKSPRCAACRATRRHADYMRSDNLSKYEPCPLCDGVHRKLKKAPRCRRCAAELRKTTQKGKGNPNWKGGKTTHSSGYPMVLNPNPTQKQRYRLEHIVVWEEANGPLPSDWVVHHLNGDKTDRRPENLAGMPRNQHHHHPREALVPYEKRIYDLEQQVEMLRTALRDAGLL